MFEDFPGAIMSELMELISHYHNLSLALIILTGFLIHYTFVVAKKPRLCGNAKFRAFLIEHVPVLQEKFWPTFWCFEARAQTILRVFIKSTPEAGYHKEFVETADGGHIAVDWQENHLSSTHKDPDTRPTVLILPGLTGSSQESYALHFVQQATRLGYRSVVFNYRGIGGAELKTARSYCAANTEDLALVVSHIKARYPKAPIVAAGVSLGGLITMNYLAQNDENIGLLGAITFSSPLNMLLGADSLETWANMPLNKHLTQNLLTWLTR